MTITHLVTKGTTKERDMNSSKDLANFQVLVQCLDSSPVEIVDEVINAANEALYAVMDDFEMDVERHYGGRQDVQEVSSG